MQRHVEPDLVDQPVWRAIILKTDGAGLLGAHGRKTSFDQVKIGRAFIYQLVTSISGFSVT
jgi:hypothetical protein